MIINELVGRKSADKSAEKSADKSAEERPKSDRKAAEKQNSVGTQVLRTDGGADVKLNVFQFF